MGSRIHCAVFTWISCATFASGCGRTPPAPEERGASGASATSEAAPLDGRALCKDRERIAFVFAADTHFGASDAVEARNLESIRQMNAMPGTAWPDEMGGTVPELCGVLLGGDLTENGKPEEWTKFVSAFGLKGTEGALRFPVFETFGNHDKHSGFNIRDNIHARHGGNLRFGGLSYGFDWGKVHFVALGEAPDDDDLAWLAKDLDALTPDRGIVVYMHFPLGGGYSTGQWFGDGDYRDKLERVIRGRNVLGIFHGHYHATGLYAWKGFDVYRSGSPKHAWRTFDVVEIGDGTMKVASWSYEQKRFNWYHQKPVFGGDAKTVRRIDPAAPP